MARSNPASFAFGMLFEIAAVVVIVSLLPRFDLRPEMAASEPAPSGASDRLADLVAPAREEVVIPTSFTAVDPPRRAPVFTEPRIQPQLSSREVEERLDRASQGLVNTLGSAAASAADGAFYSAGRPALRPREMPSFPTAGTASPGFSDLPSRWASETSHFSPARDGVGYAPSEQTPGTRFARYSATMPTASLSEQVGGKAALPREASNPQTPRQWRNY